MTSKQNFYDSYHTKNDNFAKVIQKNNFTYYEITKFFHKFVAPKLKDLSKIDLLDIGCGVGTLALYFGSLGMKVKGIDVSARAIKIAKNANKQLSSNGKVKNVSFTKKLLAKDSKKYDFILTSEVIEHVDDEKKFLTNIHSNLKSGGLLFLTTPLKTNLLYKLGFYKKFDKEVGHLRRYSMESITRLLKNNSFKILKYKEVEGPLRNLLFTTKLGFLIKLIRGPLIPIFHLLDHLTIKLFGASDILILAQKLKD